MARFERSLTGLAIFLSTLTLLFTACAVGGITAEVRWAHFERKINDCDIRVAFGLLRYYVFNGCNKDSFTATYYKSNSCQISNDACNKCEKAGDAATSFLIIGFVILFFAVCIQFLRLAQLPPPAPLAGFWPAIVNKLVTGVALEIVSLFLLITFAVFKGSCYDEMKDASQFDGYSKDLSAGFALTVLAWLFSMAAGLVEILKNPDPEVPSQNAQGKLSNAANVGDMKAPGRAVDTDNGGGVPTVPGQDLEEFLHDNQSHMEVPTVPIDDGGNNGATDGGAQVPPPLPRRTSLIA